MMLAANATAASTTGTSANVTGSFVPIPNTRLESSLLPAAAIAAPVMAEVRRLVGFVG